jgi:uncharacterized membrane protein YphA (DoxX/SURF4 family)
MVIALWIVRVVVALVFLVIGGIKVISRTKPGKKDAEADASIPLPMRLLGVAEVLGALGLILPVATGIAPVLTIAAAVCLGIVMVGATIVHLTRKEYKSLGLPLTLFLLAAFIIIGHLVWVPLA